ncbi:MAG: APC family permease [Candidatus Bathyarchaeia archaeon]
MTSDRVEVFARTSSGLVREIAVKEALVWNLNTMGVLLVLVYTTWAAGLFPGVDLPTTVLIAVPLSIPIAFLYAFFSAAMPRTGGDYVWVSRVIHPAVGFMSSLLAMMALVALIASVPAWALQYGIASIFSGLGIIYNDPSFSNMASWVSSPVVVQVFGLVYFILIGIVMIKGAKTTARLMMVTFVAILVATIAYVATVGLTGPTVFQQRFDAISGTTVATIVNSAVAAGYVTQVTVSATLLGGIYTFMNLWGFYASSYFAGEVKDVQKTQLISIVGAALVFGVVLYAVYAVTNYGFGREFIGAAAYLFTIGSSAYNLPFIGPYPQYFLPYMTTNPVPIVLVGLGYAFTILAAGVSGMWIITRNMFAWSFDRVVPSKLSALDSRYHAPYVVIAIVIVLSMIGQMIWLYTSFMNYMAYAITGMYLASGIAGFAGILFPYRRKEIFEAAPKMVRAKVAGIPIISLLGLVTLLVSAGVAYATLSPAFVGTLNPAYLAVILGTYVAALLIYGLSTIYHRKRIPIQLTFKEIPPE